MIAIGINGFFMITLLLIIVINEYIISYALYLRGILMLMIIDSILLGVVQGITEFLPISSSGHLILLRSFLGGQEGNASLLFDLVVHLVTALIIAIYFHKEIYKIIVAGPKKWLLILIGIIPAGVVGYIYGDTISDGLRSTTVVLVMLIIGSLLMIIGEMITKKITTQHKQHSQPGFREIFIMGLFQVLALIPGTSRSGSTIAGGLIAGLTRKTAATYSFLLGLPLIAGAATLKIVALIQVDGVANVDKVSLFAGGIATLISGFLAIHLLMKILTQKTLWLFIWYRLALAFVLIVFLLYS